MPSTPKTRLGCGFLCVSAILTCVLLAINGLIVMNLVNAIVPTLPPEWREPRIAQAAVFLGPLLLLLVEWWVCDVTIDWLRPHSSPGHPHRGSAPRDETVTRSVTDFKKR